MSAPVHLRVEVLYQTLDGPACGYQARGRLTADDSEVTCPKCRALMSYEDGLIDVGLTDANTQFHADCALIRERMARRAA